MAVANARSRKGCTEGTLPVTITSRAASETTAGGGLRPTSTSRAPGKRSRQRGQISRASSRAASVLGRQSNEPTKTRSRRCATMLGEIGGTPLGTTQTRRAPIAAKACASSSEQAMTRSISRAISRSRARMRRACQNSGRRCQSGFDCANRSTTSASTL